jgi:hypothetical protein
MQQCCISRSRKITAVAFAVLHEPTMVAAAAMCAAQREWTPGMNIQASPSAETTSNSGFQARFD